MSPRVRNALCYVAILGCLFVLLPESMQWHQWLALLGLWVLVNVIDVDSYRQGLDHGADIVRDFPGSVTRSVR